MARFTPAPDLLAKVARIVTPAVVGIAGDVEARAKAHAPPTKTWVHMNDALVRKQHRKAGGQEVPDNLRFILDSFQWDMEHRGVGPDSYLRFPRDESSRCFVQLVHCRCSIKVDADGIAKLISAGEPVFTGDAVVVNVVAEGDWVVEAEFGTIYPGDLVAPGVSYIGRAAREVAAEHRARR